MAKADIRSRTREEVQEALAALGLPVYRTDQLLRWLYARRVGEWDAMANLPKSLRQSLAQTYTLHTPVLAKEQVSQDGTHKYLWRLCDGALIESVLVPASPALYGEASDRQTLCVSTQVGCAYRCRFCASGLLGWKRDLKVDEIVNQVVAVEALGHANPGGQEEAEVGAALAAASHGRVIDNLVIMGMGEPLANYDNLLKAIRILNAPWGGAIGARRITVSTSGLAPEIRRLAAEPLQLRLAVSLHGATDEVRNKLMPVNRKYPLRALADACAEYQRKKGRMISFEYVLIAGVNDGLDQVPPLAELARRLRARVNLIPFNRVEGLPWERSPQTTQEAFLSALEARGVAATLRREKGHDIDAACGQLRLRTEQTAGGGE